MCPGAVPVHYLSVTDFLGKQSLGVFLGVGHPSTWIVRWKTGCLMLKQHRPKIWQSEKGLVRSPAQPENFWGCVNSITPSKLEIS